MSSCSSSTARREALDEGALRSRGDAEGRGRRRRVRRHRDGREAEAGRHRHVHDLRVVARDRRHVVGQHLSRAPRSTSARTSTASRSSRTTGRARTPGSPSCRSTSRRRSTSSGCGRTCGSASPSSRRRGTTTATSGRCALDDGTVDECHVLVSAVGFLNVPRYPDWPGLDDFDGPAFHTARWEHEHDLTGKVVAVVGTGSSATQVVPAIQPIVRAALRVPARAGLGHAQGRARLHRRASGRRSPAVAAPAGALAAAVRAGEEPVARAPLPARHQDQRERASSSAVATSTGSSPTAPTCARR